MKPTLPHKPTIFTIHDQRVAHMAANNLRSERVSETGAYVARACAGSDIAIDETWERVKVTDSQPAAVGRFGRPVVAQP